MKNTKIQKYKNTQVKGTLVNNLYGIYYSNAIPTIICTFLDRYTRKAGSSVPIEKLLYKFDKKLYI